MIAGHPDSVRHRTDPFWTQLYAGGPAPSWLSQGPLSILDKKWADQRWNVPEATRRILKGSALRERRLAVLGTIGMWRTITDQQLRAFVGVKPEPYGRDDMALLFMAGLVSKGQFLLPHGASAPSLWRAEDGKDAQAFLDRLWYHEWLAVTAGQPWRQGPQHDRHNLLAVELCLRIAEMCSVQSVVGESVAGLRLLTPASPQKSQAAADGVVVRHDGLRIAIELTTGARGSFERKPQRWLRAFGDSDFNSGGTIVLFVEATKPTDRSSRAALERRKMRELIQMALAEIPGARARGLRERIGIIGWQEWFPENEKYDRSFLGLRVWRPTGFGDDVWQPADLLDVRAVPFTPPNPASYQEQAKYLSWLAGAPHWMRTQPDAAEALELALAGHSTAQGQSA